MSETEKPTLHEIAAMPFPSSANAMRKFYVHDWGKPIPDGVSKKQRFSVDVRYEVSRSERMTIDIEAWTASEAEDDAYDEICRLEGSEGEIEIVEATAKAQGDA